MKASTDSSKRPHYNHFMIKSFSENQRQRTDYFVQAEKKNCGFAKFHHTNNRTSIIKISDVFPKTNYNIMLKGPNQTISNGFTIFWKPNSWGHFSGEA